MSTDRQPDVVAKLAGYPFRIQAAHRIEKARRGIVWHSDCLLLLKGQKFRLAEKMRVPGTFRIRETMLKDCVDAAKRRGTVPADEERQPTRVHGSLRAPRARALSLCSAHVGQPHRGRGSGAGGVPSSHGAALEFRRGARFARSVPLWSRAEPGSCEHQAGEGGAERDSILESLIKDENTAGLYAALDELPERYRDAVVLCDL